MKQCKVTTDIETDTRMRRTSEAYDNGWLMLTEDCYHRPSVIFPGKQERLDACDVIVGEKK